VQHSAKKKSLMSYSETSTIREVSDDHDVRNLHNSVNHDKFILWRAELQRLKNPPSDLADSSSLSDSSDTPGSSDSGSEAMKMAGTIVAETARAGHVKTYGTKRNKHKVIGKNCHSLGTVVVRN